MCGWLVIVVTFLVKDVLHDRLKDLVDSVNAAESLYLIRDSALSLHEEMDAVDARVTRGNTALLKALVKKKGDDISKEASSEDFARNSDRLVRILAETDIEIDNTARLAEVAAAKPDHIRQFDDLYKEWDALRMNILKGDLVEINKPIEPFDSTAVYNRGVKTYSDVWIINQRLHLVAAMILDDAHEAKEKDEQLVNICSPIAYVLFAVGAALTLLSKLMGIKGDQDIV